MPLSLNDLDAVLGYDPATHSVAGLPSLGPKPYALPSATAPRSQLPAAQAMQAPDVRPDISSTGLPSMTSPQAPTNIAKPKESVWQKIAHGAETAGDILAPNLTQRIPGTELNRQWQEMRQAKLGGEEAKTELEKAQAAGWAPMSVGTDVNGNPIWAPMRSAGQIQAGLTKTAEQEKGKGERQETGIEAKKENLETTEEGKEKRLTQTEEGKGARQETGIAAREAEQAAHPKTIVMQDADGKNYEYKFDAQGNPQKIGRAKPDAVSMGLVGTLTPLINPQTGEIQGTMNTKTGAINPIAANPFTNTPNAPTTTAGARLEITRQNQFNTQVVNPANQMETQYQRATEAVNDYNSGSKTGADGMVIFAQHLGTTLGGIKGAAIGEGAQQMHLNAIGLIDRLKRFEDYTATGQPLSASQVHDFYDLIKNTRQLQWEVTAHEGARRKQSLDGLLPRDVQIPMSDSQGHVRPVPGDQVQGYIDKGATVQYGK